MVNSIFFVLFHSHLSPIIHPYRCCARGHAVGVFAKLSRYGEVRVFRVLNDFLAGFYICWVLHELYVCDECVIDLGLLFGWGYVTVAGKAVARSVNLSQARENRPGETCRRNQGFANPRPGGRLWF